MAASNDTGDYDESKSKVAVHQMLLSTDSQQSTMEIEGSDKNAARADFVIAKGRSSKNTVMSWTGTNEFSKIQTSEVIHWALTSIYIYQRVCDDLLRFSEYYPQSPNYFAGFTW